jgi:RNA ligase
MSGINYIKGSDGKMQGSWSDAGKNDIPSVAPEVVPVLPVRSSSDSPIKVLPVGYTGQMEKPKIWDIIPEEVYRASIEKKHLRTQVHPTEPYLIHNYTEGCAWEAKWNPETNSWDDGWNEATLTCRGLITNSETGEVVARPFAKFFNHDQMGAPRIGLDEEIVALDKADGSLGILYKLPNGEYAIATRGSFASDQALWATKLYQEKYADAFTPNPKWTYLFEIIYPENAIVINYQGLRDLVLLGAVDISTGKSIHIDEAKKDWAGLSVEVFPHKSLREAFDAPDRDNAEGFVVWHPASDSRVKIKYAEYKRLHKFLTNTSAKNVWEVLSAGENPDEVFAGAPDEFMPFLKDTIAKLNKAYSEIEVQVHSDYDRVMKTLPEGYSRKDLALAIAKEPNRSYMFFLNEGREKEIANQIWKKIKPSGETGTARTVSADAD